MGCFSGISACFVPAGMCQHRLSLLSSLFRKHGGEETSSIENRTTHVIGTSWIAVQGSVGPHGLLLEQSESKVQIVSYEWICACLCKRSLVEVKEFELLLLHQKFPPVPRPAATEAKRPRILVPGPGVVDRVIAKLKVMDARVAAKRQKLIEKCDQMSDDRDAVRALVKEGNVAAAAAMKDEVNAKWGWNESDWA